MQGGAGTAWAAPFPGGPLPEPAAEDPPRPLSAADDGRLWLLDFHFPRGLTPLGLTTFAPTYAAATRAGARLVGTPGSDGFSIRFDGPHLYVGPRVPDPAERARRADGFEARWRARLAGFADRWRTVAAQLDDEAAALLAAPAPTTAEEALHRLDGAVAHEARAWRVHFEEMYALLAGHLAYRAAMADQGVPAAVADACLAGFPSRPSTTDAALLELAGHLQRAGVRDLAGITAHPELADRLGRLLATHGQRADGIADVALPSWQERPEQVVRRLVGLTGRPTRTDRTGHAARRQAARDEARRRATDPGAVDALVAGAEHANWIWWNEEHNAVIDLRASLPLRRAAFDAGRLLFDDPADVLLCGIDELRRALAGTGPPPSATLRDERRSWLAAERTRRAQLPEVLGDPGVVDDPILTEVFGLTAAAPPDARTITGMAASAGTARGRVRVIRSADELHLLQPDDVLVCEATSPSWGAAFALTAAVVCEKGGQTTHAAICAREYQIPCVVSAAGATRVLRDGQLVEVDGDAGVVRVLDS